MNRRSFLQITGITLISHALCAEGNSKSKWIKLSDEIPKLERDIAVMDISPEWTVIGYGKQYNCFSYDNDRIRTITLMVNKWESYKKGDNIKNQCPDCMGIMKFVNDKISKIYWRYV